MAIHQLMEFQIPKIVHEEVDENRGVFVVEPLDRGFGYTFGNSLRRVLLSSLEGAAVTSVKIEGSRTSSGRCRASGGRHRHRAATSRASSARLHGESPRSRCACPRGAPAAVTAGDIEVPADLEILNPELEIANLREGPARDDADDRPRPRLRPGGAEPRARDTIGVIPIDSIFSPVRRVSYDVGAARVGQRTDYDKLILDVTTDGSSTRARRSARPPRS